MENNNYVSVGNIIEQERLKRQAQIAKGVSSDVYDHIEKAHQDDLSKGVEMTDNLSRFSNDVDNLNKAETEFLLSKLQRQIVVDPKSSLLKSFKSIAINHLNDLEKAYQNEEMSNNLEKAKYQVGQPHPNNPNIVWTEWRPGKFDWKSKNGRYWKNKSGGDGDKKAVASTIDAAGKKAKKVEAAANKIDDTTIDQAEYDSQLKMAKQADDSSRSMAKNIIQGNIDKTKKKLQETISSRPGAKATITALQKDLTKFVSQKKAVEDVEKEIAAGKANKSKDVKSLTSSVQDAYSKVYYWIKEDEENGNPHSNGGKKILDYLQNIEGNLKLLSQGKASDNDLKKLQDDVKSLSSAWDAVGYGKSNLPISKEDVTKLIASEQKKDVPFKDLTKHSQVIDYAKTIDGADFEEIDSEWGEKGSKAFRLNYNGGLKLDVDFLHNNEYVYTFRDKNDNPLYETRVTRHTDETDWSVMLNPRKWANLVKSNISKQISKRKAEQTRYFNLYNRSDKYSYYDKYLNAKSAIERLNRNSNKVDKILQLS